jgi:hypothetical protein
MATRPSNGIVIIVFSSPLLLLYRSRHKRHISAVRACSFPVGFGFQTPYNERQVFKFRTANDIIADVKEEKRKR